jgi:hypothetical protein
MAVAMPILRPLPIKTKGVSFWVGAWRWFTRPRLWELMADYEQAIPREIPIIGGLKVFIEKGFVFDGASVPRFFYAVLTPLGLLLLPGLIHDQLYHHRCIEYWKEGERKQSRRVTRKEADLIFREVGTQLNGMAPIHWLCWAVLRLGGQAAWLARRKEEAAAIRAIAQHKK